MTHPFPWTIRRDDEELYLAALPRFQTTLEIEDTFKLPTADILDDDGVVILGFNELPPPMAEHILGVVAKIQNDVMHAGMLAYAYELQSRRDELIATHMRFIMGGLANARR